MPVRTEKEKMLAGEPYNCLAPELDALRQEAKWLFRLYNKAETEAERQSLLLLMFEEVGENVLIEPPFYCSYGHHTTFGDDVYMNYNCVILDNNYVRIGNHVMFGPGVQIYTAAHDLLAEPRNRGIEVAKPITIEDNVWIGGSAVLLPGVTIGRNAVVGAGAVVTRDIPSNSVVAGNPARVIREVEQG
jgi:maltose O-acetyltransferase